MRNVKQKQKRLRHGYFTQQMKAPKSPTAPTPEQEWRRDAEQCNDFTGG